MDTNTLFTILGVVLVISAIAGFVTMLIVSQRQKDRQSRIDQHPEEQIHDQLGQPRHTPNRSGRIDLGEPVEIDLSNYYEVTPRITSTPVNNNNVGETCPLCRQPVSPAELYVCSGCQTSFHKDHYDEFYAKYGYCPYCQGRSRA